MRHISLFLLLALSPLAAQAYIQNRVDVVQPQTYWNSNSNYYNSYWFPYTPYQPFNGPMRGPNSIEGHQYHPYHP